MVRMRKLLLAVSGFLLVAAAADDSGKGKEKGATGAAPALDKLTLASGKSLSGQVIDITESKVVILLGKDGATKEKLPRGDVTAIARRADASMVAVCGRKIENLRASGTSEDWKNLIRFCAKENLEPERRQALRGLLRIDPANTEARTELGHARVGDEWVDEDVVETRLKEGYRLTGTKLVPPAAVATDKKGDAGAAAPGAGDKAGGGSPTAAPGARPASEGKTEVRKEEVNSRYKLLERAKLSATQRKKMEKDREDRLRLADKFLELKAKEYQGVEWSKRHIIKTRNFEIHCNSTRKVAEAYGQLMELIRTKLSEMFQSKNQRGNLRAPIFIYASQDEFIANDRMGRMGGRSIGGYYMPPTQSITAFHGTFGFTGTTFGTLCHEGTHYFEGLVLRDFANVPIWLIEGLAVYFGDGSLFDPKTAKITIGQIPRDRLSHIQEKILLHRHTTIDKLVTMGRGGREPFTGSHYADAWALIYFLVNSGDKGKKLLTEYWTIGLDQPLKKEHFTQLAEKYFGGLEPLEKQYEDYILKLDMPPAGRVIGEYFVSDSFQFEYKAPDDEWQFFEDRDDKKMLVGLFRPASSAEIRIYYVNNDTWADPDKYFEAYERLASARFKNLKHEKVKFGKLDWFRVTYTDEGGGDEINVSAELGGLGKYQVEQAKKSKDKTKEKPDRGTRQVTRFLLIQVDGVVEIECSAKAEDVAAFAEIYSKMNENFTLCFARRW